MLDTNYTIQHTTKNISFIKLHRELKLNGVNNNKFFLRLYDERLMNVDPYDPNLTPFQKKLIVAEIKRNPFYYIREVLRLPTPAGNIPFELNKGNLAIIYCVLNSVDSITVLTRQRGKTIAVCAILSWILAFGTQNSQMQFGNKSLADAANNLKRLKDILKELPEYIRESFTSKEDIDNKESVLIHSNNNSIVIFGPAVNDEAADKAARGKTLPLWWSDETAFHKFIKTVMEAAGPAVDRVSRLAEENGKPHARIITTTPNNIDDPDGQYVKTILIDNAAPFHEGLYDLTRDELKAYIRNNSKNDFLYIEYSWRDLGFDDKWYEEQCRMLNYNWLKINREVNCVWTKASDNSVFSEEVLVDIFNMIKNPLYVKEFKFDKKGPNGERINFAYRFNIYEELDPDKLYYVGIDTAGGLNNDNSTIFIVNTDFECVANFKSSVINTKDFSNLIFELVKQYPHMALFIENNSYGKSIIDNLLDCCPNNIYYTYKISDKDARNPVPSNVTDAISYGLNTNTQTRELMFDMLLELVQVDKHKFAYIDLYKDLSTLIYNKRGKIEHEVGCHDDTLIAFLLIIHAFENTNNISKFLRRIKPSTRSNNALGKVNNQNIGIYASAKFNENDPIINKGQPFDVELVMDFVINDGLSFDEAIKKVIAFKEEEERFKKVKNSNNIKTNIESRNKLYIRL